jgi:transposase
MLGKHDSQGGLFRAATQLGEKVVAGLGFYGKVAGAGWELFRDEEFAGAYCLDNGRPSAPPSLLALARLLQFYARVSDAEVIERCRYDLRWKVALDLDLASVKAPFAKSTFQAFRARLTLHEQEGLAFEKSVREAREAGLLPARLRVALDSSPVRGRGAVKDTFNLLSDAIVAVLRAVAEKSATEVAQVAQRARVARHVESASIKGSELVDWDNEGAVSEFLSGLLDDCDRVVALAAASDCASAEVELLKKVIDQDVEREGQGGKPQIRQGVTPGRTVSVHDPQMRHGHKSSGRVYSGHKGHVSVEVSSGIITAVAVSRPGEADGAQVEPLLEQTKETTQLPVEQALGDCAYSTRDSISAAQKAGVEIVAKMPSPPKKRYGPEVFQVRADGREAKCPSGVQSVQVKKRGTGYVHLWSEEDCGRCPSRSSCTKAARRSLRVPPDFHERRERERYAHSPEGRKVLKRRVVVEHAIGRLKNRGAGRARYFGRMKTRAQWLWSAAVVNLSLVWSAETAQNGYAMVA